MESTDLIITSQLQYLKTFPADEFHEEVLKEIIYSKINLNCCCTTGSN